MNNRVDNILSGRDVMEKPYGVIFSDMNVLKQSMIKNDIPPKISS